MTYIHFSAMALASLSLCVAVGNARRWSLRRSLLVGVVMAAATNGLAHWIVGGAG